MKNLKKDKKTPKIAYTEVMGEKEFMMFDINTGSAVLYRNGEIVAQITISRADIRKALETYNVKEN